jgi:hypothetical protein
MGVRVSGKVLTKEDIAKMTPEERVDLASRMFCPVKCGGCDYDEKGRPWYVHGGIHRSPKEHNDIIRAANPKWSEEALKPYLLPEEDE